MGGGGLDDGDVEDGWGVMIYKKMLNGQDVVENLNQQTSCISKVFSLIL